MTRYVCPTTLLVVAGAQWLGRRKGTSSMTKRCLVAALALDLDEWSPRAPLPPVERDAI